MSGWQFSPILPVSDRTFDSMKEMLNIEWLEIEMKHYFCLWKIWVKRAQLSFSDMSKYQQTVYTITLVIRSDGFDLQPIRDKHA